MTNFIGMGYDFYAQDSWKADAQADARARPALLAVAAVARRRTTPSRRSSRSSTTPAQRRDDRPRRRLRRSERRSVQRHRAARRRADRRGAAAVPAAGQPAAAVSRPAAGFARDPKDGFQPRLGMAYALSDATTIRSGIGRFLNRPQINTSAAYGFNPPLSEMATVINGNVDAPGGASTAHVPAGDGDVLARLRQRELVGVERHRRIASCRGRTAAAVLRRPVRLESRAGAQHQPAAAGHRCRRIPASTPTRCGRTRASAPSRCTRPPARRATTRCSCRWSAARRAASASLAYTLSRTKDDGSSRLEILPERLRRQRLLRHLRSRSAARADLAGLLPVPGARRQSAAPLRWVLGDWDIGGVFQAQSGAPFDVRDGDDIAGVGPGQRHQFYDTSSATRRRGARSWIGTRAVWFNRNAFRQPAAGTYATTWERNTLRQPGFWDLHMSLRKSVQRLGTAIGWTSGWRRSTSSTARGSATP